MGQAPTDLAQFEVRLFRIKFFGPTLEPKKTDSAPFWEAPTVGKNDFFNNGITQTMG